MGVFGLLGELDDKVWRRWEKSMTALRERMAREQSRGLQESEKKMRTISPFQHQLQRWRNGTSRKVSE